MPFRPNLDGSPQEPSGGGGGGGTSGNGPGSNPTIDLSQVTSTGGLHGGDGVVLVFGQSLYTQQALGWQFNSTDFNCEEDCEYRFRAEEIEVYRQPTVNNVIIRYRDLGRATLDCFFAGNNLGEAVISKIVTVVFGGKKDGKIYTTKFDLTCTFEAPQLIITRDASSGPVSITKALVEMEHGDAKPI